MSRHLFLSIAVCASLTACVYHIESAIPASGRQFNQRLLGTWITSNRDTAVVTARGDGYRITYADHDGSRTELVGVTGTVGTRSVLEVWPHFGDDEEDGWPMGRMLFALTESGDTMTTASVDVDSLQAALRAGELRTPYLRRKDDLIVTGTTSEVSAAFGAALARPGMLETPESWRRVGRR